MDLFSRKIVGWAMAPSMPAELVCAALRMAIAQRQPSAGLIVHTDRGSVFCLSRFKSLTNQEIADKLGISIRTVEKHIELALRTFKEQLGSFFALFVGWFL
jgi:transposase InsO family protein